MVRVLIHLILVIGLAVVGWVSGGFCRILPGFWDLLDGPLPSASSVLLWQNSDWALSAIASIHLLARLRFGRATRKHPGWSLALVAALDTAVAAALILLSFGLRALGSNANWVELGLLLGGIPAGFWILIITGFWWLAPTFMAQREGALPILPPYPVRSLREPALFSLRILFCGLLIAHFGLLAVLVYDGFLASLLLLLPLLEKNVAGPGHQS